MYLLITYHDTLTVLSTGIRPMMLYGLFELKDLRRTHYLSFQKMYGSNFFQLGFRGRG